MHGATPGRNEGDPDPLRGPGDLVLEPHGRDCGHSFRTAFPAQLTGGFISFSLGGSHFVELIFRGVTPISQLSLE